MSDTRPKHGRGWWRASDGEWHAPSPTSSSSVHVDPEDPPSPAPPEPHRRSASTGMALVLLGLFAIAIGVGDVMLKNRRESTLFDVGAVVLGSVLLLLGILMAVTEKN